METIYTIPLNESFSETDGCPFCRLREQLEKNTLEYTLGAAMMEPEIRIEMNRLGFCRDHFVKLAGMKNKLSLALILETRLGEVLEHDEETLAGTCFVCNSVDRTLERYMTNTGHIYSAAKAFRDLLLKQEYFCLPHAKLLLHQVRRALRRKQYEQFREDILQVQQRYLASLKADARKFADSFDYRNADKELGSEKQVLEKASKVM
jgi:hypothetical protein